VILPAAVTTLRWVVFVESSQPAASSLGFGLESLAMVMIAVAFLAAYLGILSVGSDLAKSGDFAARMAFPRNALLKACKYLVALLSSLATSMLGLSLAACLARELFGGFPAGQQVTEKIATIVFLGSAAISLISVLAAAIAAVSVSRFVASAHFVVVFCVAPTSFALFAGPLAPAWTSIFPISGLQAATTQSPAIPVTLEGVPPSVLGNLEGFLVVFIWAALYSGWSFLEVRFPLFKLFPTKKPLRLQSFLGSAVRQPTNSLSTALPLIKSELYKFLTLRGAWVFLLLALLLPVVLTNVFMARLPATNPRHETLNPSGLESLDFNHYLGQVISSGVGVSQLFFVMLGMYFFTYEFSTGSIIGSILAVPRRIRLWFIKLASVIAVSATVTLMTQFLILLTILSRTKGLTWQTIFAYPAVSYTVWASASASVLCCAIGFGLAGVFRNSFVTASVIGAVFLVFPSALGMLQSPTSGTPFVWIFNLHNLFPYAPLAVRWMDPVHEFMPSELWGGGVQLNPAQGMLVILVWAIVCSSISFIHFQTRPFRRTAD